MNQREIALNIISKTISDESYANLLMRQELNKLPLINRPFVSELVYGTLRHYDLLMYQIKDDINEKTKVKLKYILVLALYERFFMNQKDYVTNNEYVSLAGNKYDKAFINAVLHKIKTLKYAEGDDEKALAINHSLPLWIVKLLSKQYSKEDLSRILTVFESKAKTYYRINPKKADYQKLSSLKIEKINEHMFTSLITLTSSKEFKEGFFYIQDLNSSKLVDHLDLEKGLSLLDVCSAPGSKLFNCLEILDDKNVWANDLYAHRIELIKKKASILGYENINYLNVDGQEIAKHLNFSFDRILLDVPCSGLGVISRKPDLKFHINPSNLDELERLQEKLLSQAYELIKKDGIILYSTCTLNTKENTKQIQKFISNHQDIKLIEEETIINEGGDCFYYAKLKRL